MSGAMDSRAAVFSSSPQSVEVFQAGTWWSGELLGWRHDAAGTCQMRVRVVVGGVEETAWIDLAALRLPGHDAVPAEPSRIGPRITQELPPAQAVSALRGRPVAAPASAVTTVTTATATTALPLIRDELAALGAPAGQGAPTATGSRRGGRRRAPEDTDVRVVAASPVPVPAGRHRAPDDEGRHRAADTEVFAAVAAAVDQQATATARAVPAVEPRRAARPHSGASWAVPSSRAPRPEESYARSEVCTGRIEAEPDLLTRPMRLSDLAPHARRPRASGSRSGA